MQAIQETFDGFWRDIARQELLEVLDDFRIAVFEFAVRVFSAILPPILRQFREHSFFEAAVREIASFGNLCLTLSQPFDGQLDISLAGALPNNGASLFPGDRISNVGDLVTQKDAPIFRLHVFLRHACFL